MKLTSLALPAMALTVATVMILPERADAFSTLGFALGLAQRDLRVFNNFSDPEDNDNQTPNPDFPAYFGADMAIWKGAQEWTSEQYGSNFTDPHQQYLGGDLGGTPLGNFDVTWQGNSAGIGGINDNVHSQISGCNGGVLAFAEGPSSNGWRIRYYECWTWADGPGNNVVGIDLQSVACHEFGHALGLGHSTVNGATMFPSGGGVGGRSINFDDKDGVRAIYGAAAANKPHISSLNLVGTALTITGTDFTANNNRVWFTQLGTGGNGTAVKVTGLTSNGTTINLVVPAGAGPGMLLMRNDTPGAASLSNAVPFDPGNGGTGPIGNIYCFSNPNSTLNVAQLTAEGSVIISDNNVNFEVTLMPTNQFGYFLMSSSQGNIPLFGGSAGVLCLGSPLVRFAGNVLNSGGAGMVNFSPDLTALPSATTFNPGETWSWQMWYRDGGTSNTTDGLEILFL